LIRAAATVVVLTGPRDEQMLRKLLTLTAAVLAASGLAATAAPAHPWHPRSSPRPAIFVHGFSGSGAQFETQARRFASNGYPAEHIEAHDYDSLFTVETVEQVFTRLDQRIARLLERTGADRVDLLAHSLGTRLMQDYLRSSPARAALVAHYVNLDGATASAPPGDVPTLAVWGEGSPERAIVGATNVYLADQSHTQVVTSAETFVELYRFLTGRSPRTTAILPQAPGEVRLSGRAVLFPSNLGVSGARLEIYEVHRRSGARRHRRPAAVFALDGDGSFGPFPARGGAHYEFAIVWPNGSTHHLYYQPFRRTDRLIRLLTSRPGEGLAAQTEVSDRHSNLVITRYKEWWGDQGAGGDALAVDGLQVLNAANSPRAKRVIGIFAYDAHLDRATDLRAPIPLFFSLPFLTGIDLFVPADQPPDRPISIAARPRGGGGRIQVMNVPNWRSLDHQISVHFDDYLQPRRR
jgi:pimeloyl-ACP methyl ester carboxylesterase